LVNVLKEIRRRTKMSGPSLFLSMLEVIPE